MTAVIRRRKFQQAESLLSVENVITAQVPFSRHEEIKKYLELFRYKPERTILQVHVAVSFQRRKGLRPEELVKREREPIRYGGRTFTVVETTHDPSVMKNVIGPRKSEPSAGYVGYLFQKKDRDGLAPHELLPLDFIPQGFSYPTDWKEMFATNGFLIAIHVSSSFASKMKNELLRKLRRFGKRSDPRQEWMPFIDELARENRSSEE